MSGRSRDRESHAHSARPDSYGNAPHHEIDSQHHRWAPSAFIPKFLTLACPWEPFGEESPTRGLINPDGKASRPSTQIRALGFAADGTDPNSSDGWDHKVSLPRRFLKHTNLHVFVESDIKFL